VSTPPPHSVGVTNIPVLADDGWVTATARCPKHMAHGPCAGVRADGSAAAAVSALRAAGFGGLVLCCVPVVTSAGAAEIIASFAADRLPRGYLDAITSAPDPMRAGLAAAANLAQAMLEVPGVNGVNLSSAAAPGQEAATMRALAEVSRRVLGPARSAGQAS
jgi:methylenetetrahydrofolate reductase (NADPH)